MNVKSEFKRARYDTQAEVIGNAATVSKGKKRSVRSDKGKKRDLAKFIKTVIQNNAEKKEVLTSLAFQAGAVQSTIVPLNIMGQGVTGITRVGLETKHAYVEVDIGVWNSDGGNGPYNGDFGFWAIVLDRETNGALPTFAQIFDDSLAVGQGTDFRITTSNQDRFKIISRNEWSVGCSQAFVVTTFITGAQPYHIKEFVDLSKLGGRDQSTNYLSAGTTIAALDHGAIYFVFASSLSDASNITEVKGQAKYRFTDL